eukprot:TRINITY_DN7569_c0_g1_i1.p1 TRINITY_DN7569_c0_g1~~TRINITY_DN7569_c0_g1_i1.p1  ORF type:complete len:447 (+),score=119.24 TRINITY_DN7569_c0_g1_i1:189-1529(+)
MDSSDGSLEGRLHYLEQGSQQLKQQMQVMKSLVTTEVDELKGVMKQQTDDMKQIIVHQDKLYQERIRRLEGRVEQLAEFAMYLAQSKGMAGTMPPSGGTGSPQRVPLQQLNTEAGRTLDVDTSLSQAPLGIAHDSDEEGEATSRGYQAVLEKYRTNINNIYKYYTETASRALYPSMTLQQFTRFTKDCGLCNSSQGGTVAVNSYLPPPELLWMNVIRRLPRRTKKHKESRGNFAMERVLEISKEQFPDVLVILAEEQYGRSRPDMNRSQVVELFLVSDVFPVTDSKIMSATSQRASDKLKKTLPGSINNYNSKEVTDTIREYWPKLKNTFQEYVTKYHSIYNRSKNLSLQGFCDIMSVHGLLPLINKADIRQIFLNVKEIERAQKESQTNKPVADDELEMDMKEFMLALRHIAEHVYGERGTMAEKYQTPDARIRKLLSKMYLLKD